MKFSIYILIIFGSIFNLFSQSNKYSTPDYERIESSINDSTSGLFYNRLMERFLEGDSTLSLNESRHLYYGYFFHENYSPYDSPDYMDSIRAILSLPDSIFLQSDKFIAMSDSVFKYEPFNLHLHDNLYYFYYANGKTEMANKIRVRLNIILDAIFSTGNGLKEESAFHVLYTAHEYFILNIVGFEFGGEQSLIGTCDYLSLKENDLDLDGLYFNVSRLFIKISEFSTD
ncbi:DUF4919 domain-containing protein [Marinigracilibium pacificum]|uniref:DUF4919 domain-containing protein n=1 Tax=Marinigracilibium pacificum TaxID=2729599 RepID=A0A848IZF2_9BACT|nr:DUF4919 domain-containing protein [Marinigracilibium pacificum]NMM47604.1 DUF4919 domain-containing protein [Marinigracilibium pacificum]